MGYNSELRVGQYIRPLGANIIDVALNPRQYLYNIYTWQSFKDIPQLKAI